MNQELYLYEQKVRNLRLENIKLKEQLGYSFSNSSMTRSDTIICTIFAIKSYKLTMKNYRDKPACYSAR